MCPLDWDLNQIVPNDVSRVIPYEYLDIDDLAPTGFRERPFLPVNRYRSVIQVLKLLLMPCGVQPRRMSWHNLLSVFVPSGPDRVGDGNISPEPSASR